MVTAFTTVEPDLLTLLSRVGIRICKASFVVYDNALDYTRRPMPRRRTH